MKRREKLKFKFIKDSNLVEVIDISGSVQVISLDESENLLTRFMKENRAKYFESNVVQFPIKVH